MTTIAITTITSACTFLLKWNWIVIYFVFQTKQRALHVTLELLTAQLQECRGLSGFGEQTLSTRHIEGRGLPCNVRACHRIAWHVEVAAVALLILRQLSFYISPATSLKASELPFFTFSHVSRYYPSSLRVPYLSHNLALFHYPLLCQFTTACIHYHYSLTLCCLYSSWPQLPASTPGVHWKLPTWPSDSRISWRR